MTNLVFCSLRTDKKKNFLCALIRQWRFGTIRNKDNPDNPETIATTLTGGEVGGWAIGQRLSWAGLGWA